MDKLRAARFLLLAASASHGFEAAIASACWHPNEIVAAQVKDFQYLLMVGTLRCRAANPAVATSYNQFVTRHQGTLNSSAIVLKAHFLREIGIAGGQKAYDEHATLLSNRHSARHDAPSFCATVNLYSRMAALASDSHFVTMAQTAIDPPVSGQCNPAAATIAARVERVEPVVPAVSMATPEAVAIPEPAPAAVVAAVPAAPIAPATVASSAPPPAATPAGVPAGAKLIAEAPIVPPQTVAEAASVSTSVSASPERQSLRALQDAIKALQAATEALAAQQTTPI